MDAARAAVPSDLPAIAQLARQAAEELAVLRGGAIWRLHIARREPIEETLDEELARVPDGGAMVVGTIDETVVGYGVSRLEELADGSLLSIISDLYVDPGARGVGVGEAMVGFLIDHATVAGAIGVDSLALPGDRGTKNFFESFGLKARAIVVHRAIGPAAASEPDDDR